MTAPLHRCTVESVSITRDHCAVVLLCDESPELREWLWGTLATYRGRATGTRFRLTIDSVSMDCRAVFARHAQWSPRVFVTVTSWPHDTSAAVFGRKVGKEPFAVKLERVAATRKQAALPGAKTPRKRRVTVQEEATT